MHLCLSRLDHVEYIREAQANENGATIKWQRKWMNKLENLLYRVAKNASYTYWILLVNKTHIVCKIFRVFQPRNLYSSGRKVCRREKNGGFYRFSSVSTTYTWITLESFQMIAHTQAHHLIYSLIFVEHQCYTNIDCCSIIAIIKKEEEKSAVCVMCMQVAARQPSIR